MNKLFSFPIDSLKTGFSSVNSSILNKNKICKKIKRPAIRQIVNKLNENETKKNKLRIRTLIQYT